jgi:hypothetical protein
MSGAHQPHYNGKQPSDDEAEIEMEHSQVCPGKNGFPYTRQLAVNSPVGLRRIDCADAMRKGGQQ